MWKRKFRELNAHKAHQAQKKQRKAVSYLFDEDMNRRERGVILKQSEIL